MGMKTPRGARWGVRSSRIAMIPWSVTGLPFRTPTPAGIAVGFERVSV